MGSYDTIGSLAGRERTRKTETRTMTTRKISQKRMSPIKIEFVASEKEKKN